VAKPKQEGSHLSLAPGPLGAQEMGPRSQKLILFIRENATSGAPIISGTNQLPNLLIRIGITMKKIITKAWAVMMTL
jgi:hypothetical protein